ncbi:transposase [Kribbella sp. NBC_01510]|uniref:transposase n=1 Tax=Kribbella sp. NBC_01510 TaxID=2903581 RepID=UPI0038657163
MRKGTYSPEWLLERCKCAEAALITVVADCYLAGVSTAGWTSSSSSWGSTRCRSPRSPGWRPSWTRSWTTSRIAGSVRLARSRSWPPMRSR